MSEKILRADYGGTDHHLKIGDIEIPCYVLDNGQRVIVAGGFTDAIGLARGGSGRNRSGGLLGSFLDGAKFKPHVPKDLDVRGIRIPFKLKSRGGIVYGYEATVLADVCEVVIKASEESKLPKIYDHIVRRCKILYGGFARVGIIALIDEATGYQTVRKRDELHKILEAYVNPEFLPWTRMFPDSFYEQLFKLRGLPYNPASTKRPALFARDTEDIVYKRLPPGVCEELKRQNPKTEKGHRKRKHHQHLTEDIGHPHLKSHLIGVIALMRASANWSKFKSLLNRAYPKPNTQLELSGDGFPSMNDDSETD